MAGRLHVFVVLAVGGLASTSRRTSCKFISFSSVRHHLLSSRLWLARNRYTLLVISWFCAFRPRPQGLTIRSSGPLRIGAVSSCFLWQRPLTSSVSRQVNPFHIVVSLANLFFGLLFVALLYFQPSPGLAALSEVGGLAANAVAVIVAIAVTVLLALHAIGRSARLFLTQHWLGLFNGLFVVACWVGAFSIARLFHR